MIWIASSFPLVFVWLISVDRIYNNFSSLLLRGYKISSPNDRDGDRKHPDADISWVSVMQSRSQVILYSLCLYPLCFAFNIRKLEYRSRNINSFIPSFLLSFFLCYHLDHFYSLGSVRKASFLVSNCLIFHLLLSYPNKNS